MLRGLVRAAKPETHLRQAVGRLLETVLQQAGLPGPLRVAARSYFKQASDETVENVVDVLEQVVKELRDAQALDTAGSVDAGKD